MSKIFKLNAKDLLRGLIVVILATIFSIPVEVLAEYIPFLDNQIVAMVVSVMMGYLLKNLATDDEGKLVGVVKIK